MALQTQFALTFRFWFEEPATILASKPILSKQLLKVNHGYVLDPGYVSEEINKGEVSNASGLTEAPFFGISPGTNGTAAMSMR
jgi:hypothetical protein